MGVCRSSGYYLIMPKTRNLTDLFRAIGSHDLGRAAAVARELATRHGKRGQFQAERDLLGALNGSAQKPNSSPSPTVHAVTAWNVHSALLPLTPSRSLSELRLGKATRQALAEVLAERRAVAKLTEKGIPRRWRLLFHGPPGCGKTATAAALGHEAGLPTFLVRFDGLIGAYLGQTALRLRDVFRFAETTPCVLLFDEVDALAKRRGSPMDVGELDRIVIAFLQELEHAHSEGFLIAGSNLPRALDDALWRRFDMRLAFPKPRPAELASFSSQRCRDFGFQAGKPLLAACRKAPSFAEAEQCILDEARRRVLREQA